MQFCTIICYKLRVFNFFLIYCRFLVYKHPYSTLALHGLTKRPKTGVGLKHIIPISKGNNKQK